jgi:hypothetical protein
VRRISENEHTNKIEMHHYILMCYDSTRSSAQKKNGGQFDVFKNRDHHAAAAIFARHAIELRVFTKYNGSSDFRLILFLLCVPKQPRPIDG